MRTPTSTTKRPPRDPLKGLPAYAGPKLAADARTIPVGQIRPDPDQPRKDFDPEALVRLAGSMTDRGQLVPIRVRKADAGGGFLVLAGERRWRAAKLAGLATLTAIVHAGPLTPDEVLAIQLVENCCREDLTPIDQARAMRSLIDRTGWNQARLADELGLHPGTVSRALALLALPESVRDLVVAGELSAAVARVLDRHPDKALVASLAVEAARSGWTAIVAAGAVYGRGGPSGPELDPAPQPSATLPEVVAPNSLEIAPRNSEGMKTPGPVRPPARQTVFGFVADNGIEITIERRREWSEVEVLEAVRQLYRDLEARYLKGNA